MKGNRISFGISTQAVGAPGLSDHDLYAELMADVAFGRALGYQDVWLIEHHFSDYYPTPDPLLMLAHIAALHPDISLGTMVMVSPWYNPLRMAEQIAMLSNLSRGHLHLGLGRGTAKLEYDAFDIDMSQARDRFRENFEIVTRALRGEVIDYQGQHYKVGRPVRVRPQAQLDRVTLYGAVASTESGAIMGSLGLPPISVAQFPHHIHKKNLDQWREQALRLDKSINGAKPLMVHTFVADTDQEADRLAREHFSRYFDSQVKHYETEANYWKDIKGYESHSRFFANMQKLTNPAGMDPWLDLQFVGSPKTVARRLQQYIDLGYNHFIIHCSTPGVPKALRHAVHQKFATQVIPEFRSSSASADAPVTAAAPSALVENIYVSA
jgi:alkanesulfonate monooxygenase SsuD/methylene tetrahydromethanopterin reductase-like flavin-dependent oxidoreductase (luciferase family)